MAAEAPWPEGVRAGITLRNGGQSGAPWDSFNLGSHVGDRPEDVAGNRARLRAFSGVHVPYLEQVHGVDVHEWRVGKPDGCRADVAWTQASGMAASVLVADCLPLLISDGDGTSVAAVHAGWRGLAGLKGQGVLEALCREWPALQSRSQRADACVWLGPCIGPQTFEVGPDVREAFVQTDPEAAASFEPLAEAGRPGKWLADLPALARRRLHRLGFARVHGNDGGPTWCTVTDSARFFSHRRDATRLGSTGRMAALIWRGGHGR